MRYPAVAGQFYAGDRDELKEEIEKCFRSPLGPGEVPRPEKRTRKIIGAVVPHAGYMFSGPVAAHLYGALAKDGIPPAVVILGPNHTGRGSGVALATEDFFTPLGEVPADRELAKELQQDLIDNDLTAHEFEHSIEVQLPFLQFLGGQFKFVPICMALQDYDAATSVGRIIARALKGRDAVVLASTDFSHYVAPAVAKKKDGMAIEQITNLDPKGLYEKVMDENISMCGYGPVMAMLTATKERASRAELLKYATSGDVRPMRDVVGYAAIRVER